MEGLKSKYKNFALGYKALKESIQIHRTKSKLASQAEHNVIVAGVIKHFEMVFQLAKAFLQAYLEEKFNVVEENPAEIFKACYKHKILPEEVVQELRILLIDRNKMAHIYDRNRANQICEIIEEHYEAIGKIFINIPPQKIK